MSKILHVKLAEKPAELLAFLNDHGPATSIEIAKALDVKTGLYSGGLTTLHELGLATATGLVNEHDQAWRATDEGRRLVCAARAAAEATETLAQIIVQEGRDTALEIAETAGVEAALDAVMFIADNRQAEMVRHRDALDSLRPLVDICGDGSAREPYQGDEMPKLVEAVRRALAHRETEQPKETSS